MSQTFNYGSFARRAAFKTKRERAERKALRSKLGKPTLTAAEVLGAPTTITAKDLRLPRFRLGQP